MSQIKVPTYGGKLGVKNLLELRKNPIVFLDKIHKSHGPTVKFKCGPFNIYSITRTEHISYVMGPKWKNFSKDTPGYKGLSEYIGNGLLTHVRPSTWKQRKTALGPSFSRPAFKDSKDTILFWVRQMTESIQKSPKSFNMTEELRKVTLCIICDAMLGVQIYPQAKGISDAIETCINHSYLKAYNPFYILSPSGYKSHINMKSSRDVLRCFARGLLENQEAFAQSLFLQGLAKSQLSDAEKVDEIITLLQAGHETSATTLNWLFYRLASDSKLQTNLRDEIISNKEESPTDTDVWDKLNQCLYESLRFDPSTWIFDRKVVEDEKIVDFNARAGDLLLISPFIIHRDKEEWRYPNTFNVENFDLSKEQIPKNFMPFSVGPRLCPGRLLALMEIRAFAYLVLQKFNFAIVGEDNFDYKPSITLKLNKNLTLDFKQHN